MEAIYAIDSKNGLSKKGTIPWKSKKDILFFMNKTKNNIVIMGKNTYFSLPNEHRPLKNRLNIVLTSKPQIYYNNNENNKSNVIFTNDDNIYKNILTNREKYNKIYQFLKNDFKIFFIGGKTIYEQFIPLCEKIWVTQFKYDYNCDLFIDNDYDYLKEFKLSHYDEDDELKIIEYSHM
jgi:dihydrofolate reductase